MKPQIGTIVVYHTTKEEREVMRNYFHCNIQEQLPAIVVASWGYNTVSLKIFLDGDAPDIWKTSVLHINENLTPTISQEGFWEYIEEDEISTKKEEVKTETDNMTEKEETVTLSSSDYENLLESEKFLNIFLANFNENIITYKTKDTIIRAYNLLDKLIGGENMKKDFNSVSEVKR
jgi:hypothetical protein